MRKEHKPRGSFDFRLFAVIFEVHILAGLATFNLAKELTNDDFELKPAPHVTSFVEIEQSAIADCLGVAVRTVQRGLDRLDAKGWVTRFRGDQRAICGYAYGGKMSSEEIREMNDIWLDEHSYTRMAHLVANSYVSFYDTEKQIRLSRHKLKFDGMLLTASRLDAEGVR